MTPRPPDSSGTLSSAETNPLPHVSSARAWTAMQKPPSRPLITLPKASPVIREKPTAPRRLRADGTEEICADDIMVIVPKTKHPSADEIVEADILVEVTEPAPFRAPAYSVHATQEILPDDVMEVQHVANQMRDERPSTVPPPWTVDISERSPSAIDSDDLEFPGPPKYSGQYPAYSGPRLTAFSTAQVFRRRNANLKIVVASVAAALTVVTIAGLARFAPVSASATDGPIGIAVHAPKKLDKSVRGKALAYGKAPRLQVVDVVSIDALPVVPNIRYRRR